MESLDMHNLASSLPISANTEKQLMDNFKAAALSITTLYRSSLDTSKRSYTTGYATCLLDILRFVEAGVSVSASADEAMSIGRVMDWVDARLEAIKSSDDDDDDAPQEPPPQEHPLRRRRRAPPASSPPAPSPSPPPPPAARPIRQRRGLRDLHPAPEPALPAPADAPIPFAPDIVIPAKRRHAPDPPASSSVRAPSPPSGRRRRPMMDVEDDVGRERKRVARR